MKSRDPLISVIINCHNGEKFLQKSVNSILAQSYKNFEVIFWDNNSTDTSKKIIKNITDKRIRYFKSEKFKKLYECRNLAIQKAKGKYITFLDVDDLWNENKLELQMPLFKDSKVGVVYGNLYIINKKLNTKKIFLKRKKPKGFILDDLLKNYCTFLTTIIIRKNFLVNYKPIFNNSFNIIGDFDLMIRMSTKYKFDCVETPIASYRIHGKNESLLNKDKQVEELKIWQNLMKEYPAIASNKNFSNISTLISNLEIVNLILENKIEQAKIKIKKIPNSFKKIKYYIALLLPNNFVKKFIRF